ncbi:MAG: malectin domain-containing carbohydrate-binding protein [Promicromonosporaceae bacterium]|nr:malectin domain-containing carbohydrate-binding protein [Promicromonosporaceae bacterium]
MRLTAIVASLAVAAGLVAATPLPASAADPAPDPGVAAAKIAPDLKDRFHQDPVNDFWITFGTNADLSPASKITDWTQRGQFVYDALKKSAKESEATVARQLDAAGVKYTSYPLVNAVLVKGGTQQLALDVASVGQVAEIHASPQASLVEPVDQKTPADDAVRPDAAAATTGTTTNAAAAPADATTDSWGVDQIRAPQAWAMGATGAGIVVSSLDSGVQFDHPALVAQYRGTKPDGTFDHNYNWMATRGGCSDAPCDDIGHGTHTMGTMVGADGIGVAPDAQWISTNGCCSTGVESLLESGWWLLAPTDLQGNNPDVSKRPHIINNSWGQDVEHNFDDFFQSIDEAWTASGIFSVWSSGNTSPGAECDTVSSPGSAPDAYSVGAYDQNGDLASFSRKGEGENGVIKPEISAPGVGIRSSYPGNQYVEMSGTSMAAPHVAGAVADLWSYDPTLIGQVDATRKLLAESAVDVDDTSCGGTADDNNMYGEGRLDLPRLLALAPRQGGTLSGTVTADGTPLTGASVAITGPFNRTVVTDRDGTFSVTLPVGDYQLSVTAFGYQAATTTATLTLGQETSVAVPLVAAARHDISGSVVDEHGDPVPNADVAVAGTPVATVHTAADGTFALPNMPEGQYKVTVTPNSCFAPASAALTVGAQNDPLRVSVGHVVDGGGYTCAVSDGAYLQGTDPVEFTSGVSATVNLPFPVALYNGSHTSLTISLRGTISPSDYAEPGFGGAGLFPFYVESPLDFAPGGGVFTAATKVDGEDAFTIEFRNAKIWAYPVRSEDTAPVSFSATLTRSGKVIYTYGDGIGTDDPVTAGVTAVTGIQGWAGVDGIMFSDHVAALHDGEVVTYDLPAWGTVDSKVVDANDGQPITGAKVSFATKDGLVESVTTDATGLVHRQLPVGDYTMTVEAPHYVTGSYAVTLDKLYAQKTVDARLATGLADVKTDGLDTVLGTDQDGVGTLTLTNHGSAPMTYTLGEAARHPELDAPAATTRTGTGATSTIDLAGWKNGASGFSKSNVDGKPESSAVAEAAAAAKVGPTAGGDVITKFEIPGTDDQKEPTGVGYDGDVWIHDYNAKTNTAYTVTGKPTGKVFDANWNPDYRAFDMALDTTTGDMCQMEDSPASYIHCFDRSTGKETRQIKGDWSTLPLTGLAYNPKEDVFYVGGRYNGMIGTVAGTSHPNAGQLLSFCSPPLPEIIGMAYNQASNTIWYTDLTTDRPTRLLQVDPDTCSLVNAWWFPGQKVGAGGGLETDSTGALWAVDQLADDVMLVDVEDDLITDLPWLSLSSSGGTLAPGESTTVKVSISSKGQAPGTLGANIVVRSESGRQSKTYVPVTLTTTKYQVGVNAGGAAFADATGFTWAADHAAGDGTWGYQGKDKTTSTTAAIAGTDDDALFQSQRTSPDKDLVYTFPDAPKGTYAVDLGFAETEQVDPGKRVFDVLVDGHLTQYAYDAKGTVGEDTADWHSTVVQHDGGPLTVELRGGMGLRAPSIAALRVTLDPRGTAAETPPTPSQPDPGPVPVSPAGRSYSLKVTDGLYRQGTTDTGWQGDDLCGVLWFDKGFLFPFYDTTWDGVCVSTNGALTFDRASTLGSNTSLPSPYPADSIYPLWDDLYIDDQAGIYVGTTTVDGLAAQVIEYRNATFYSDRTARVSFSVTLIADGRIQIGYGDGVGGDNPLTRGSSATVGVESLNHNPASQYSFDQPVLTAGLGLEYSIPASGTIEGTATDANDGAPIAGAVVTLHGTSGDRTISADAQGRWKAQALLGDTTVEVAAPNYVTSAHTVTLDHKDQAEVLDTALTTGVATVTSKLDWFLGRDQKAKADVTVKNTGSAPLTVRLSEQARTADGGHQAADLPWLTLSGKAADGSVVLAVGESTTVTATASTAGVDPGVLAGDVLVASDAGKNATQYEPARLATSAYWLGVDVGGAGLTGADGFVWSADQALGSGAWGYTGGTVRTSTAAIGGTDDDSLFQTQRTGKTFTYTFKDAPAGTYRIGLDFAETDQVKAGARTFDVLVDGKAALYAHDVVGTVGGLTADTQEVTVVHSGGDLTVQLQGAIAQRDPILSALKVQEDPRL